MPTIYDIIAIPSLNGSPANEALAMNAKQEVVGKEK